MAALGSQDSRKYLNYGETPVQRRWNITEMSWAVPSSERINVTELLHKTVEYNDDLILVYEIEKSNEDKKAEIV